MALTNANEGTNDMYKVIETMGMHSTTIEKYQTKEVAEAVAKALKTVKPLSVFTVDSAVEVKPVNAVYFSLNHETQKNDVSYKPQATPFNEELAEHLAVELDGYANMVPDCTMFVVEIRDGDNTISINYHPRPRNTEA